MKGRITLILMASLLVSLMLFPKVDSSIGVGVNPAELFFTIDSGSKVQTQNLYVINLGDEEASYEVFAEPAFPSLVRVEPRVFNLDPGEYMRVRVSVLPWRFPSTEKVNFKVYIKAKSPRETLGPGVGPGIKVSVYIDFAIPSTPVSRALDYLRGVQASDGGIGDFASSAWAAMAIAAAGEDPHKWRRGDGPSIVDYLRDSGGRLDPNNPIDWAWQALAAKAAGEDPRSFGGTDCIKILKGFYHEGQLGDSSLLNDDFWGLMALVSAGEEDQAIIDNVRAFIKANQNPDGGWGYGVGLSSDVDDTAAAIMALTAAGEPRDSEAMMKAVSYLKGKLGEEGGFIYDSIPNSASDSLAIMALEALGVDVLGDEWTRKGVDPVSHLLSLQNGDGSFSWRAGRDGEALWTAYAILALLGKPLILGFIVPLPDISNSALMFLASILVLSNALALTKLKAGKRDILGR